MARKCKATQLAFAKHDCANHGADGSCLGIVSDSLAPGEAKVKARRPVRCILSEETPRRCGYFEKCVLPLANWPSPKDDPTLQSWRLRARDTYRKATGRRPGRKCRDCGGPMPSDAKPNALYCAPCARKRYAAAHRKAQSNYRQTRAKRDKSTAAKPHGTRPEEGHFSEAATKGLPVANSAD